MAATRLSSIFVFCLNCFSDAPSFDLEYINGSVWHLGFMVDDDDDDDDANYTNFIK